MWDAKGRKKEDPKTEKNESRNVFLPFGSFSDLFSSSFRWPSYFSLLDFTSIILVCICTYNEKERNFFPFSSLFFSPLFFPDTRLFLYFTTFFYNLLAPWYFCDTLRMEDNANVASNDIFPLFLFT